MKKVLISFGANIGDILKNFNTAFQKLEQFGTIKKISSYYKTKPEGFLNQPDFTNGVLVFETQLSAEELLSEISKIENSLGRERKIKNGPRTIDLDILFYDKEIINSKNLIIPHPRLYERIFVLQPLKEVAGEFECPKTKKKVIQLYQDFINKKYDK